MLRTSSLPLLHEPKWSSVPGRLIPETLKMVLDTSLLNTQQYKVYIKGKVGQSREKSWALPTPRCSSYWKGSLLVALDNGRQLTYSTNNIAYETI